MKTEKNFRLYFNLLILTVLILALGSSSAHNAWGQQKENSQSTVNETASLSKEATPAVTEAKKPAETKGIAKSEKRQEVQKLTAVQKMLVKKMTKKMNPESYQGEQEGQALDQNLKFAIIFGAVGVVLMLFPSPLWIIGAIALTVGVVFLILWVLEQ